MINRDRYPFFIILTESFCLIFFSSFFSSILMGPLSFHRRRHSYFFLLLCCKCRFHVAQKSYITLEVGENWHARRKLHKNCKICNTPVNILLGVDSTAVATVAEIAAAAEVQSEDAVSIFSESMRNWPTPVCIQYPQSTCGMGHAIPNQISVPIFLSFRNFVVG